MIHRQRKPSGLPLILSKIGHLQTVSLNSIRRRFLRRVFNYLIPQLLTWFVLLALTVVITTNLRDAGWVPDSTPFTNAAWMSLILGACLAASRFSPWGAFVYHLVVGFLSLGLWIGKVLPSPGELALQSPLFSLDLANIRIFSYMDRLRSWISAIFMGGLVQDNGLFQLLIGLLVWACVAWMAWSIFRHGKTLAGLLPSGLLLAINTQLSVQSVDGFWLFLACALVLTVRHAFLNTIRSWEQRLVDYPDELGWNWGSTAVFMGLVILLAARLSPWVGTPDGWKALGNIVRDAQKHLETTTTRLFGDVNPPPARSDETNQSVEIFAPSADTPEMATIGVAPSQSKAVVMWVSTNDPPPPEDVLEVSGSAVTTPIHYWRSAIFGKYTGTGWEQVYISTSPPVGTVPNQEKNREPTNASPEANSDPQSVSGRYLLAQQYVITARHGPQLFAAAVPVSISSENNTAYLQYAGPDGEPLAFGNDTSSQYSVASWVTSVTDTQLRGTSDIYSPEIRDMYLRLPASLPQRVRDLTRRVVSDAATPYDKSVRIQDYLRQSYQYDVAVPLPPSDRDVVDYFLFDSPGGFCSYYSTAMVVMLRSLGIPARVASGFATGAYDYQRAAYRVTPADAHAWPEVYFPEYGWIEFEPTAGLERIGFETDAVSTPANLPPRPTPPAPLWQSILVAATAVLAPIFLFGLAFWMRARRRKELANLPPTWEVQQRYLHLRRWLAWAGLRAPPSATPGEYLAASLPLLREHDAIFAALEGTTAVYQLAAYSSHPITNAHLQSVRSLTRPGWSAWVRLFMKRFWIRYRKA